MKQIPKEELLNKFVEYRDKNGAFRHGKVKKIIGNTLTVLTFKQTRERVKADKVIACIYYKKKYGILWR